MVDLTNCPEIQRYIMQVSEGKLEEMFKLKSRYLIENTKEVEEQCCTPMTNMFDQNYEGSLEAEGKSSNTDSQETFYTVLAE